MTIDKLIAILRHNIVVGGGYAEVDGEELEMLFAEIERLRKIEESFKFAQSCAEDSRFD